MKTLFVIATLALYSVITGGRPEAAPPMREHCADSTEVPACIRQLNRGGVRGVRSYSGAHRYTGIYTMNNGTILYRFSSEASIGCNRNEPASAKYYNDSCLLVASFPRDFSIKKAFKPFIAEGYLPADFTEAQRGDYPAWFANEAKLAKEKQAVPRDPFPTEKSFTILQLHDSFLPFKVGDVIKIHTKSGLWHFPAKGNFTRYKIVPQLSITRTVTQCRVPPCPTLEKTELVYFMGSTKRFIKISNNGLFFSTVQQADAHTPTKPIELTWKTAMDLQPD